MKRREVRAMFDEQVAWAVDADVDQVIGETFSWAEEHCSHRGAGTSLQRSPRTKSGSSSR